MSSPGHPELATLPSELLLMIADHLPSGPLCKLSITCHAFHCLLHHARIVRFTSFALDVVSGFDMCDYCRGCCRVPASKSDYDRALKLLQHATGFGCAGVVKTIQELRGMSSGGEKQGESSDDEDEDGGGEDGEGVASDGSGGNNTSDGGDEDT